MALSLRNSPARGSVGLDIDDDYIAAVKADGSTIEFAASSGLPKGLVRDGEVVDGPGLTAALKDFFKQHDLPKSVRLGVTNQQIVLRQIELPMIEDPKDLAAAVRFQAAEAIAMPLDEAVLDHHLVSTTPGEDGERAQVVVVAARETMIRQLADVVRGAGLKPEGIDLDAFALVRMLASEGSSGESARIFLHLAGITNLAIAVGRMCLFTRPLATHWDDASDAAAAELSDEVRLSLDYYMAQPNARTVDEVVLSGPDAERPGLPEALESALGLPVKVAQPLGRLEQSDLPAGETPFRYTVAAGLALGAAA
jgi:type IV pilus assembly protein PilM